MIHKVPSLRKFALVCVSLIAFNISHVAVAQQFIVPAPPELAAKSYILMDTLSGTILVEHAVDKRLEPASITKIMTAYVAYKALHTGHINFDDQVTVSEKAWRTEGSRMFLEVGKSATVESLLRGIVVQSGNDASVALAEFISGTEESFVQSMNAEARSLGMENTHFVNASGLPHPNQYVSARDIALLAQAMINEFPEHYRLYAEKQYTYNNITQHNRNRLLWQDPSVDGIKTGFTDSAGFCLASSAIRDGMRLIAVVLGSESSKKRAEQSLALLNFGFRFFTTEILFHKDKPIDKVRVWGSANKLIPVGVGQDIYVTKPRGDGVKVKIEKKFLEDLEAPIAKGQVVGSVVADYNEKHTYKAPLIILENTERGSILRRLTDAILRLL